jgi:putative ABC transport system permease protein
MHKWLEGFAYRIEMSVLTFVSAGMLTLLIALLTVSYQAIRASVANPVEALRHE